LYRVSQEIPGSFNKLNRVRIGGMAFESGFVLPFRVNGEPGGFAERFEGTNRKASGLGSGVFDYPQYFFAKFRLFAGLSFKAHQKVERQGESSRGHYGTGTGLTGLAASTGFKTTPPPSVPPPGVVP